MSEQKSRMRVPLYVELPTSWNTFIHDGLVELADALVVFVTDAPPVVVVSDAPVVVFTDAVLVSVVTVVLVGIAIEVPLEVAGDAPIVVVTDAALAGVVGVVTIASVTGALVGSGSTIYITNLGLCKQLHKMVCNW